MTAGKAGLQRGSRMTVYPHMLSPHALLLLLFVTLLPALLFRCLQ